MAEWEVCPYARHRLRLRVKQGKANKCNERIHNGSSLFLSFAKAMNHALVRADQETLVGSDQTVRVSFDGSTP